MAQQSQPSPARTLLIVDDNDSQREGLALLLGQEGYAVETAANGQEALDYLAMGPAPNLIVLDMLMPVLDGWRFLDRLRRLPGMSAVPVIVTTGTILTREWADAHGCVGFVHKPFPLERLVEE